MLIFTLFSSSRAYLTAQWSGQNPSLSCWLITSVCLSLLESLYRRTATTCTTTTRQGIKYFIFFPPFSLKGICQKHTSISSALAHRNWMHPFISILPFARLLSQLLSLSLSLYIYLTLSLTQLLKLIIPVSIFFLSNFSSQIKSWQSHQNY